MVWLVAQSQTFWSAKSSGRYEALLLIKLVDVMDVSRTIQNPKGWCHQDVAFNMSANLEGLAVAKVLEKVNPHSSSQEGQYLRMFAPLDNCTHLPC